MEISKSFLREASEILGKSKGGLTGYQIINYFQKKSYELDVDIPYSENPLPKELPNKRTALYKNLEKFSPKQQYAILKELCEDEKFEDNFKVRDLKIKLITRYSKLAETHNPKFDITSLELDEKHWLSDYPKAYKHYQLALEKYRNSVYERNLLDDLRLSIELLLKNILKNNKSLENQIREIGSYQKEKGSSPEIRNMLTKLIDYYTKYQNNYVKHSDEVKLDEIEFIMELSESFMRHLTK